MVLLAAIVIVVGVLNPGPRWRVSTSQDATGNVLVDGDPVPASDFTSLTDLLHPGVDLEWRGQGDLELASGDAIALRVLPGSVLTLPEAPGRYFARTTKGALTEGEIRVSTGRAFEGATLVLSTPEADVRVSGATLAVIREPVATCVCVLDGNVRVKTATQNFGLVSAGQRQTVFNNGQVPERDDMRPAERIALERMRTGHP